MFFLSILLLQGTVATIRSLGGISSRTQIINKHPPAMLVQRLDVAFCDGVVEGHYRDVLYRSCWCFWHQI